MSIEALIQAHTEALLANTEAVKLLTLSLAGRSSSAANKAADAVENTKSEKKADPKPEVKTEAKEEPKVKIKEEPAGDSAVDYGAVRALLLKLAPTNRDGVRATLAAHSLSNLKNLLDKEDDFGTVNDQAKLEAVYADLQVLEA